MVNSENKQQNLKAPPKTTKLGENEGLKKMSDEVMSRIDITHKSFLKGPNAYAHTFRSMLCIDPRVCICVCVCVRACARMRMYMRM